MDSQRKRKECSNLKKAELYLLKKRASQTSFSNFENHLKDCKQCNDLVIELDQFYNTLASELQKPVSHYVFKLVKEIEQENVIVAGILLKPQLLDEIPGERQFVSELILTTYYSDPINLDELDCIPVEKDEVLVRAIQSINTQQTTLFLYSENKNLYANVTFKIPKMNKTYLSDDKGKIELGYFDIYCLDDIDITIIA
jgi:hypothetical protein